VTADVAGLRSRLGLTAASDVVLETVLEDTVGAIKALTGYSEIPDALDYFVYQVCRGRIPLLRVRHGERSGCHFQRERRTAGGSFRCWKNTAVRFRFRNKFNHKEPCRGSSKGSAVEVVRDESSRRNCFGF
jgi:hypothetical protein